MKSLLFLLSLSFLSSTFAQEGLTIVAVGKAQIEREKIYFDEVAFKGSFSEKEKEAAAEMVQVFRNDFSFYQKRFHVLPVNSSSDPSSIVSTLDYWDKKSLSVYSHLVLMKKDGKYAYAFDSYRVKDRMNIVGKEGVFELSSRRALAHRLAAELYTQLTHKEAIFGSKLVFVCDQSQNLKNPVKELFMMDFDGYGAKKLTSHGATVLSPAVSPDGKRIVYSLIKEGANKIKNVNLYLLDLTTGQSRVLSNKSGINSGAVFFPDGEHIALTLSLGQNADIYAMNLASGSLRKITNHYAIDVDPSLSSDGKIMTFLSGRSGNAMIYTMDPLSLEKDVRRISYVGQFNATPRFAPQGHEIVFASWLDNCFDLFRINADGSGLVRLTKKFGSNEDPVYSNDGEFIVFTSQRVLSSTKAVQNLYIMDRDGEIMGSLTKNFGNCTSPRWINPLK